MILVTKIEQYEFNQKFFNNIIVKNLHNNAFNKIVVFTDTDYSINNSKVIIINENLSESSCIQKVLNLLPNQIICWAKWNQIFNNKIQRFSSKDHQENLYQMNDGEYDFIIFNPQNFIKKYSQVIDCLLGKKIDISNIGIKTSYNIDGIVPKFPTERTINTIIRTKGQRFIPKPIEVEVRKIDTIIVSVDYNDTLFFCLQQNKKYLDNITVVTSEDDYKCQEICRRFEVDYITTESMFENNSGFNKGKAINEAIRKIKNPDWILLLDADIVLVEEIKPKSLEQDVIYTSSRYICENYSYVEGYLNGQLTKEHLGKKEEDKGCGFFQLFNYNSKQINKLNPYSEKYTEDVYFHQDMDFKKRFIKNITLTECIHLGKIAKNWRGRKSKKFIEDSILNQKIAEINEDNSVLKKSERDESIKPKLAVLTTFFNPNNYLNIKYNYSKFSKKIKEKADLFTIELSFDGEFYTEGENTIRIRGNSNNILWQKERLLNILLEKIPKEYTNIAWIDCDILFQNKYWVEECNEKLQTYKIVQLYEKAERLDEKGEIGTISRGLLSRIEELNQIDLNISLGIPGFAWAARREVLEKIKFLDTQIIGGGDSLMCNAFLGNKDSGVVRQMNTLWSKPFIDWANNTIQVVGQSVNYVSGNITHLYHGKMTNRKYNDRYKILSNYNFNPSTDLKKTKSGLWQLKDKSLESDLKKYFEDRNEDDNIIDINKYFDKIFVINLDRKKDKLKVIDQKLKKLGIEYERFSAIDGRNLRYDNSKFKMGKGMIENNFALGCLLSHLEVIKTAKHFGYKRILIFEDDVLISENIKVMIQDVKKLKDWKLLNLGASQYDWKIEHFDENFYLSKKTLGGFAYGVDCSIYEELISLLKTKTKSSDNILADLQEKYYGSCYTFYPYICVCDVSQSEIRESREVNKHAKKMKWNLLNNYI